VTIPKRQPPIPKRFVADWSSGGVNTPPGTNSTSSLEASVHFPQCQHPMSGSRYNIDIVATDGRAAVSGLHQSVRHQPYWIVTFHGLPSPRNAFSTPQHIVNPRTDRLASCESLIQGYTLHPPSTQIFGTVRGGHVLRGVKSPVVSYRTQTTLPDGLYEYRADFESRHMPGVKLVADARTY
jgi:hypothetical protein